MIIDDELMRRIDALNNDGVSCFRIAKEAGVQPGTVRRFMDGVSSRMEEETHLKIMRAVETLESGQERTPIESSIGEGGRCGHVLLGAVCGFVGTLIVLFLFGSPRPAVYHVTIRVVDVLHESGMKCIPTVRMDDGSSGGGTGGNGGGGYRN